MAKVSQPPAGFKFSFDFVIELLILAAIFLIPTIFDRRLGIVFSGTKVAWLRFFVLVIISLWAEKIIITKEHRFIRTPLDWPILTFLLATTVATLTSVHVFTSFVGFYGRFEGLTTWYLFGLLFFIVTNYIHTPEQVKRILVSVIAAGTIMSVYGVIQRHELDPYMWGGVVTWQRVIGTIGQPNFEAAYILMAFFLALVLFFRQTEAEPQSDWTQQIIIASYYVLSQVVFVVMIYALEAFDIIPWYFGFILSTILVILFAFTYPRLRSYVFDLLLVCSLFLIFICLLYTQSRGGLMGFLTGLTFFSLVVGRRVIINNWPRVLFLGLGLIMIFGFTLSQPGMSPFKRFSSEISTKTTSNEKKSSDDSSLELKGAAGSRGETWKSAFKIIADYPFFGIGPEVLKMVFPRYETELFRYKETFHVKQDRCHNETMDVPVTKGLIALVVYGWLLFTLFRLGLAGLAKYSTNQRLLIGGLLAAALAYLVQNQFSFGVVAITSLFWIIWALVFIVKRNATEVPQSRPYSFSLETIPWFALVIVNIILIFFIYLSFFSFMADASFKAGKTELETKRLAEATIDLKKSLSIYPFEGTTISHLAITYLNMGNSLDAAKYLTYGTKVDPYNADNFYMLSRIDLAAYDRGEAAALNRTTNNVKIALAIDPYYSEAYDTMGAIYERQGKILEAAKMYEKAFDCNPTIPDIMQRMIVTSQRVGRHAVAKGMLQSAAAKFPDNLDLFKALQQMP